MRRIVAALAVRLGAAMGAHAQSPDPRLGVSYGNVGRRLPDLNNPAAYNIDAQFEKNTRIRERLRLLFRAELFDALNQAIFSGPTTSIASSTFGKIVLSRAGTPRQAPFSLRLRF